MVRDSTCAQLVVYDVVEVGTMHLHLFDLPPNRHSPHLVEAQQHQSYETRPEHHSWVEYGHNAIPLVANVGSKQEPVWKLPVVGCATAWHKALDFLGNASRHGCLLPLSQLRPRKFAHYYGTSVLPCLGLYPVL